MAEPRLIEIATPPFFRLTRFFDAWDAQGIPAISGGFKIFDDIDNLPKILRLLFLDFCHVWVEPAENASKGGLTKEEPTKCRIMVKVDDPDAPVGNFTHWLMWNIVPALTEIVGNKPPLHAVQGVNDFGKSKYSGPCPPPGGVHRYYFRLYALDASVGLPPKSKRNVVDSAMKGHMIAEATLMARYAKKGSNR